MHAHHVAKCLVSILQPDQSCKQEPLDCLRLCIHFSTLLKTTNTWFSRPMSIKKNPISTIIINQYQYICANNISWLTYWSGFTFHGHSLKRLSVIKSSLEHLSIDNLVHITQNHALFFLSKHFRPQIYLLRKQPNAPKHFPIKITKIIAQISNSFKFISS